MRQEMFNSNKTWTQKKDGVIINDVAGGRKATSKWVWMCVHTHLEGDNQEQADILYRPETAWEIGGRFWKWDHFLSLLSCTVTVLPLLQQETGCLFSRLTKVEVLDWKHQAQQTGSGRQWHTDNSITRWIRKFWMLIILFPFPTQHQKSTSSQCIYPFLSPLHLPNRSWNLLLWRQQLQRKDILILT